MRFRTGDKLFPDLKQTITEGFLAFSGSLNFPKIDIFPFENKAAPSRLRCNVSATIGRWLTWRLR